MNHLRPLEVPDDRQKVADDWRMNAATIQMIAAIAHGLPADRRKSLTTRQGPPPVSESARWLADACRRLAGGWCGMAGVCRGLAEKVC